MFHVKQFMKVKDHFKTNEEFEIVENEKYKILETLPKLDWNELTKYYNSKAYISHRENSTSLLDEVYHLVKNYMFRKKKSWISKEIDQGRILDFGAGTGEFLNYLPNKWEKTAYEPNVKAKEKISEKEIEVVSSFKEIKKRYDVITAWHALEHVLDIDKWFEEIDQVTKKGSYVFIAVPNYQSYDAKYYDKYWAAYDVPRHRYHFSKAGLIEIFKDKGYENIKTYSMPLDAFYISIKSEKYKKRNNLLKAVYIGLKSNLMAVKNGEFSSNCLVFKHLN